MRASFRSFASHERRLLVESEIGMGPRDDALQVAGTGAAADRIVDPNDAVAQLVQPAGFVVCGAVRDVLAVDVLPTAPLAVPVAVEPEVQPGAQVEAGGRHGGDRQV